jgi:hypothetical protein
MMGMPSEVTQYFFSGLIIMSRRSLNFGLWIMCPDLSQRMRSECTNIHKSARAVAMAYMDLYEAFVGA